jgi:hypothetical protein
MSNTTNEKPPFEPTEIAKKLCDNVNPYTFINNRDLGGDYIRQDEVCKLIWDAYAAGYESALQLSAHCHTSEEMIAEANKQEYNFFSPQEAFIKGAIFGYDYKPHCQEKDKWVKVEEGLPEDNQLCIIFNGHNVKCQRYLGIKSKYKGWFDNELVTHWQSLPQPPNT